MSVRNDGSAPWSKERLAYKIQTVDPDSGDVQTVAGSPGQTAGPMPIQPGQIARTSIPVALADARGKPLPVGEYRLHWFVRPVGNAAPIPGTYDEMLRVVARDPGVNFVLSDIPRQVDAGKDAVAQIAVQNVGPTTWGKKALSVGYHWYYLDGQEAQWNGTETGSLDKDVITNAAIQRKRLGQVPHAQPPGPLRPCLRPAERRRRVVLGRPGLPRATTSCPSWSQSAAKAPS